MSGALDTALRAIAKQVVSDFGSELNTTITYSVIKNGSYNVETGQQFSATTTYTDIKVPIAFVRAEEDEGRETRRAKLYITPDLIGNNQPNFNDEITLTYAGGTHTAQIIDIDTKAGGQTYLFIVVVRF